MKFTFAKVVACLVATFSWIAQAFQIPAIVRKQFQYGTSTQLYRSLSGIISASSTSLTSLAGLSRVRATHDTKMISIDRQSLRKPSTFSIMQSWIPSWVGKSNNSDRVESRSTTKEMADEEPSYKSQNLFHRTTTQSAQYSLGMEETSHHLRGMHVAGFMDYDPKQAARSAYNQHNNVNIRRENSWFFNS